jgi:uncharacterized protein YjbI with pentapeptide repeats
LTGADLAGAWLAETHFYKADLSRADLGADLDAEYMKAMLIKNNMGSARPNAAGLWA